VTTAEFLTANSGRTVLDFGQVGGLCVTLFEGSDMLATNSGSHSLGFSLCLKCGYADSERKRGSDPDSYPPGFVDHVPLRDKDRRRWRASESPVLRHQHFSAMHNTDRIEVNLAVLFRFSSLSLVTSFGHALHLAAAQLLEIDPCEIGLVIAKLERPQNGCSVASPEIASMAVWFDRLPDSLSRRCTSAKAYACRWSSPSRSPMGDLRAGERGRDCVGVCGAGGRGSVCGAVRAADAAKEVWRGL
jgi:hypothetical protein